MTGRFTGTVTFGSGEPNQTQLTSTSASVYDIFVAKIQRQRHAGLGQASGEYID